MEYKTLKWRCELTNQHLMHTVVALGRTKRQAFDRACRTAGKEFLTTGNGVHDAYWTDGFYACRNMFKVNPRGTKRATWRGGGKYSVGMFVTLGRRPELGIDC